MLKRILVLTQASTALAGVLVVLCSQQPTIRQAGAAGALPVRAAIDASRAPAWHDPAAQRRQPPRHKVTLATAPAHATVTVSIGAPQAATAPVSAPSTRRGTPRTVAIRRATTRSSVPTRSPQQRMDLAVARIPGYHTGDARWELNDSYGSWGTADWYHNRVYISPRVPGRRIYDVVSHEWSHLLSVRVYGGDVNAAVSAMNAWFGGSDLVGAERAADCMAKQLGAQWTHYTPCETARWQQGARDLLAGRRLSN